MRISIFVCFICSCMFIGCNNNDDNKDGLFIDKYVITHEEYAYLSNIEIGTSIDDFKDHVRPLNYKFSSSTSGDIQSFKIGAWGGFKSVSYYEWKMYEDIGSYYTKHNEQLSNLIPIEKASNCFILIFENDKLISVSDPWGGQKGDGYDSFNVASGKVSPPRLYYVKSINEVNLVDLRWKSLNATYPVYYHIDINSKEDNDRYTVKTMNSFAHIELTDGVYTLRINAINKHGESNWSNTYEFSMY